MSGQSYVCLITPLVFPSILLTPFGYFPHIDHISSSTATMYPIEEIAALCREYGVMLLVDGAHAPGQLDINLEELGERGVDFYIGRFVGNDTIGGYAEY